MRREVRTALRESGELVRAEAETLFEPISILSASRYRVRVRQRGVSVEQSLRKTTGKRPDYGALQMRDALIPARSRKSEETAAEFEHALDRVAAIFET